MKFFLPLSVIVNLTTTNKNFSSTFIFIILSFYLLTPQLNAQNSNSDRLLAKVGNLSISESEFLYRLNFTPKEGIQDKRSSDGIKKELLYTLIAEKLWANEAIEKGYENNPSVITAKRSIEKMFVRDELYRREIKDKINVNDDDISKGLIKYSKILELGVFFSESYGPISKVFNDLNNNNNINNINDRIDTSLIIYKSVDVSFGDLPAYLETKLYDLNVNQFTMPIEFDKGWNLYYIKQIKSKEKSNEMNDYKQVVKILKKRQEDNNYEKFYSEFFKDKKVDVDGKLFLELCSNIKTVFEKKNNLIDNNDAESNEKIVLDSDDVNEILSMMNDVAKDVFVKFDNKPIDLESFVREISFNSFSVPTADFDSIKIYLNKKTKEFIKYEFLAREGFRMGLDKDSEVKTWVNIWFQNFLFQAIKNNVELTDEDLKSDVQNIKSNEEESINPLFKDYINQTIKLSEKYKYEIDENIYSKIEQGNINLFVLRHLGFGGTISGVPSSPVFIEWYLELQKRKSENLDNVL